MNNTEASIETTDYKTPDFGRACFIFCIINMTKFQNVCTNGVVNLELFSDHPR